MVKGVRISSFISKLKRLRKVVTLNISFYNNMKFELAWITLEGSIT